MAEKKSPHHDEFMQLHMFKEEYIAKLEALGIETPEQLAEALGSEERIAEIHEHLKGVGPKTIEHWKEDMGIETAEPVEKPAPKTRKVKSAEKKPEEKEEAEEEEGEAKEKKAGAKKKEEEEAERLPLENEAPLPVQAERRLDRLRLAQGREVPPPVRIQRGNGLERQGSPEEQAGARGCQTGPLGGHEEEAGYREQGGRDRHQRAQQERMIHESLQPEEARVSAAQVRLQQGLDRTQPTGGRRGRHPPIS